jgi:hypothetical protein
MPYVHSRLRPKLEPEVLDRSHGLGRLGGAAALPDDGGIARGSATAKLIEPALDAPITVALCDGSQFMFARLVDLRISAGP